jgi:hypothetical protein
MIMYLPTRCSDTPLILSETYLAIDVMMGKPMLAARAVLLGIAGAIRNSVRIMLYDMPVKFLPNNFINRYAILNPRDDFVITLEMESTQNSNHGIMFEKPVKLDLTSIVDVKFAKTIPMNRVARESQTSSMSPLIIATNMIAVRYPATPSPSGGSTNHQQMAAMHNIAESGIHLILAPLRVFFENLTIISPDVLHRYLISRIRQCVLKATVLYQIGLRSIRKA